MFRTRIEDVTKNLLILNVVVWVVGLILAFKANYDLNDLLGLHYFQSPKFKPWQLITSMFSHALVNNGSVVFYHILFNMFMLYMFGSHVERSLGKKKYFILYFVAGLGASILHQAMVFWEVSPPFSYLVGASGAVFGILAAFAFLFPNVKLMLLFPPIPVKAKILIPIFIILELFLAFSNFSGDNIAHFAHLGGVLFGIITLLIWRIRPQSHLY